MKRKNQSERGPCGHYSCKDAAGCLYASPDTRRVKAAPPIPVTEAANHLTHRWGLKPPKIVLR